MTGSMMKQVQLVQARRWKGQRLQVFSVMEVCLLPTQCPNDKTVHYRITEVTEHKEAMVLEAQRKCMRSSYLERDEDLIHIEACFESTTQA